MNITKTTAVQMIVGALPSCIPDELFTQKASAIIDEFLENSVKVYELQDTDDVCYAPCKLDGIYKPICLQEFDFDDYESDSFIFYDDVESKTFYTIVALPRRWFCHIDSTYVDADALVKKMVTLMCDFLNEQVR